jgi:hypothetical protein
LSQYPANAKISLHTLRISMDIQELRSTCEQISQRIDSTPRTIIRCLLPQQGSPESLPTSSPVNPSEIHNNSQIDHSKEQNSPLEIPYGHSESEDNSSSSILESRVLLDQGKIFGFTSRLLINRMRRYGCSLSVRNQVHSAHTGSELLLFKVSDMVQDVQTE